MTVPFRGVINVDVRDSTPDWTPYMAPQAPEGATQSHPTTTAVDRPAGNVPP